MPDFASVLTVTGGRVADSSATVVGCECPIKFSHKKYKKRKRKKKIVTILGTAPVTGATLQNFTQL